MNEISWQPRWQLEIVTGSILPPGAPERQRVLNLHGTRCTWEGAYIFRWDAGGGFEYVPRVPERLVANEEEGYSLTNRQQPSWEQRTHKWQVVIRGPAK